MGLAPQGKVKFDRVSAIRMLGLLPGTPARYFGPLLDAATGASTEGARPHLEPAVPA